MPGKVSGCALLLAGAVALAVAGCSGGTSGTSTPGGTTTGTSSTGTSSTGTSAPAPTAAEPAPTKGAPEVNPAGDIPDNQVYVPFSPATKLFRISVPEGWGRSEQGPVVTFADKLNSIRVESSNAGAAPTEATERADLARLGSTMAGFTAGKVSTVTRKGGRALLVTYRANAAADPVTGKTVSDDVERYRFFRAGHLVTVTLAGPHGADNVDPWRTVTDSFRWSQ
jgi:hypothetical protein